MKLDRHIIPLFLLLIVIFIAGTGIGYVFSNGSSSTFTISSGIYPSAVSYTIYKEDSTYYAKNAYGYLEYIGTSASQIIQNCINELTTSGGIIYIKNGLYLISNNLLISGIDSEGITIIGEGVGDYDTPSPPYTQCGTVLKATTGCTKIIEMLNSRWFTLKDLTLDADDIADYCFYADNVNNTHGGEANIYMDNVYAWGVSMGKTNHTIAPVKIWNSVIVWISHCFFHHGYASLWLGACSDIWITDCDIEGSVVGILTEFCNQIHITSTKIADNREAFANTDYAGTANAAGIFFSYMDTKIVLENVLIWEFMRHGIRIASDVVGSILLNNIVIAQSADYTVGTSYGVWNQGCDLIKATNIDIWDKSGAMDIGVYDQGDDNVWTNIGVKNSTSAWSFTGIEYRVSNWMINGKPIEKSGTAEASYGDMVSFGVILAGVPQCVIITVNEGDARYIAQAGGITATDFTLYLWDDTAGVVETVDKTISWYAEYKP